MRNRFTLVFLLLLSCASVFAADEFKIDPAHSSAQFSVKHMLVSNVSGRFRDVEGTIVYDEKDPAKSSVNVVIKTTSITTDNDRRDNHLRSGDFFDAEKYPEIRFVSTKVTKQGDEWVAVGNLTMKDVTKQISLPFSFTVAEVKGKKKMGVEASTKLNRHDYHVDYDQTGATVGADVKIELNLEANVAAPAAASSPAPASAVSAK